MIDLKMMLPKGEIVSKYTTQPWVICIGTEYWFHPKL